MAEHPLDAKRRREWDRIRVGGLARFLVVRGLLLRGLPMALAVALLLDLLNVATPGGGWREPGFLARLGVAALLFSMGGMLSAYARWRALDARFGEAARNRTGG